MPSGKARYQGDTPAYRDFSAELREKLRRLYLRWRAEQEQSEINPPPPAWEYAADNFVEYILTEAHFAIDRLVEWRHSLTKPDIQAEKKDLLKTLKNAREKLRSLSLDLDSNLSVDADPLGCADSIDQLIAHIEAADKRTHATAPWRSRYLAVQRALALEMTVRVLRVLTEYGTSTAATWNDARQHGSPAVEILRTIGDDIGLRMTGTTWRDYVAEAKRENAI